MILLLIILRRVSNLLAVRHSKLAVHESKYLSVVVTTLLVLLLSSLFLLLILLSIIIIVVVVVVAVVSCPS